MGSRLDGPPVVPRRDDDGIDPVHNPFVVRRAPERVGFCEGVGFEDALDDLFAGQLVCLQDVLPESRAGPRESPDREVRDDPQVDAAAGPLLEVRGDRLCHRIHRVGAHGVAAVDHEVGDDHRSAVRLEHADLDVLGPAADLDEHRVLFVREGQDLVPMGQDRDAGAVRIRDPDQLDLAEHDRTRAARREAAVRAREPGRVRGRGHDARLLDGHRDQVVPPVHAEIDGDPEGQRHRTDDILDHMVDLIEPERAGVSNRVDLGRLELPELADDLPTLVRALLVEARHVGALHWSTGRGKRAWPP